MNPETQILAGLNGKQIEAVKTIDGPVLVISGPGSGKTRCLTHRIAYLISSGVRPENILAVTFTNKAAGEIKERIAALLENSPSSHRSSGRFAATPQIGTFHSVCARILRREIERIGYSRNFTILDEGDQASLIKKIMASFEVDTKRYNPRSIRSRISKLKTELVPAESYTGSDFYSKLVAQVYRTYQENLKKMNALDFDDLIGLTVRIFKSNPETLAKYHNLWHYILVDEYQDTSHDQYVLVSLLAQKTKNLFCIGDDAQSIYMCREADIRNILNFEKDYPDAKIVMLEQNYRSTKTILAAADEIIANNKMQMPKELWTENNTGEKIIVKETLNERDEANFIVYTIEELAAKGRKIADFVVLYRTHAQSRAIEEALIKRGFPYQIIGGIKFYERREIKDILSYLRLINNPSDIISFSRAVNIPTRGIGDKTVEKISFANKPGHSLIETADSLTETLSSDTKQKRGLAAFSKLIAALSEKAKKEKLTALIKSVIDQTNYEDYLKTIYAPSRDEFETADERIENLKELLTVAKKYDATKEDGLASFLEEITLLQNIEKLRDGNERITLMTVHSSKGLEFPVVFIAGMEEGLFPHNRTLFEPKELEEERRLCYVAVTRAKEQLIVTYSKYRRIFGTMEANLPSRFIGEIPTHLVRWEAGKDYEDEDVVEY